PLAGIGISFDLRSRSRHLLAELTGTLAVASVASAIALAGGAAWGLSIGLWLITGARAVATIPYVRLQLRRRKGQAFQRWGSDLAQVLAVDIVVFGLVIGIVSAPAVVAIAVLGALQVILARTTVPPVPVIGARQIVFGLAVIVTAGLGANAPR
ncbi:MAG: hypothetical protein KJP12_05350, partial [Acidimicrobiia bacterium]|nr:hypothetical protein [Acidimicrobiia bacterium]